MTTTQSTMPRGIHFRDVLCAFFGTTPAVNPFRHVTVVEAIESVHKRLGVDCSIGPRRGYEFQDGGVPYFFPGMSVNVTIPKGGRLVAKSPCQGFVREVSERSVIVCDPQKKKLVYLGGFLPRAIDVEVDEDIGQSSPLGFVCPDGHEQHGRWPHIYVAAVPVEGFEAFIADTGQPFPWFPQPQVTKYAPRLRGLFCDPYPDYVPTFAKVE